MKKLGNNFWILLTVLLTSGSAQADCKDPALRKQVAEVARVEGVDEKQLLSVIAHESRCNFYVIAWNSPRRPETARSKFFDSLDEAKEWAEELIATKQYRVDVGIGQINNEAHLQPKRWTLDEVLNPKTALIRVAQVLKERGWANYHSSNPVYAEKWQRLALAALSKTLGESAHQSSIHSSAKKLSSIKAPSRPKTGNLVVFDMTKPRIPSSHGSSLLVSIQ